jgi:DNA-binding beta-propeller fold protein YncE
MKTGLIAMAFSLFPVSIYAQGYNHQWLLGNYNFIQDPKGRMYIDSNSINILTEFRKMPFYGTQGNISDSNGNLLMASNGVWIANATGDTMMNGSGINPGGITPNWPNGLPMTGNNVFVNYPGDSTQYILFHHSADMNGSLAEVHTLYYSLIEIPLDSGRGGVVSKNNVILTDTLGSGIGICKHSNGRDWWVIFTKDNSSFIYEILFDNNGISLMNTQNLGFVPFNDGNVSQLTFSPDGTKFISSTYDNPQSRNSSIVLSRFNRCTGMFSNTVALPLTSGEYLWGLAFSPSGKYAYAASSNYIYQIDADTYTLVDTVATFDGFISPGPNCCYTSFWNLYLAADGKIYVTSGSSVRHFSVINSPDSAGIACDIQQHSIFIGNYAHLRAVPNHPNYYLGCDTTLGCPCLTTGIDEAHGHDFKFSVSPNPTSGQLKIMYLLPQNKSGKLELFDINGRRVYEMNLPPWSTLQQLDVSFLSGGVYNCVIKAGEFRVNKKLVVVR